MTQALATEKTARRHAHARTDFRYRLAELSARDFVPGKVLHGSKKIHRAATNQMPPAMERGWRTT
jgi:hypothetical protein